SSRNPRRGARAAAGPSAVYRRTADLPGPVRGYRRTADSTRSSARLPPYRGLHQVQDALEVRRGPTHGQVQHQAVVAQLEELGEHVEVDVGPEHSGVPLPGEAFAGGGGDRVRPGRPAPGEVRIGAQPAGHLELGAKPAGDVRVHRGATVGAPVCSIARFGLALRSLDGRAVQQVAHHLDETML